MEVETNGTAKQKPRLMPQLFLAFACIVILGTGTLMYSPIIIPYTISLGGIALHGTIIESVSKILACLGVIYIGHLSTWQGRRRTLIYIYLLGASGMLLSAMAPNTVWLLISSTITSLSFASMAAVMMTYLVEISPEGRQGMAMGVFGTGIGVSAVIGALMATTMAEIFGFRVPFLFAAGATLAGALFVSLFFVESIKVPAQILTKHKGIHGLRLLPMLLKLNFLLLFLYIGAAGYQFLQSSLSTLLTPLVQSLGLPLNVAGIGIGAFGIFGLMQPLGGRLGDHFGRRQTIIIGAFMFVAGMFVLYSANSATMIIIGTSFFGIGTSLYVPSISTQVCLMAPVEARGAAMGLYQSVLTVGAILGPVSGGFALQYISPQAPFMLNGVIITVVFLLLIFTWQNVKSNRDECEC